jgi:glutathione synthase/RimK-type ligase-like ATP-grasp enzyme
VILILTGSDDPHADAMERVLDERGVCHLRLDPAMFPAAAAVSVEFGAAGVRSRTVRLADRLIDLDEITAVWVRRPTPARPVERLVGTHVGDFIVDETGKVVADLWELLDVPFLPAPRPVLQRAQFKMRQLQLAAELGLELPPTVVTNDPDALLEFAGTHPRLITKQGGLTQPCPAPDGTGVTRYTELLLPRDLAHVASVALCPVIVQAYVPKRLELRVTVVGSRVFAAAIHSQAAQHTRNDWRRYDDAHLLMEAWTLPPAIEEALIALNARLGLRYSASDFVLTPDGRYVYLETNPSGQFLWVQQATGMPITEAIADELLGGPTRLEAVA